MAYTTAQLSQNFPIDTTAHLKKSIAQIDDLVQQGVLSDNDLRQLLPYVGTALDTLIEQVSLTSATYTGGGGAPAPRGGGGGGATVSRQYAAIPCYPLPVGGAQNPASFFINQLPTQPPEGRIHQGGPVPLETDLDRYIGASAAFPPTFTSVGTTAETLDQTNFTTIIAPAVGASVIPSASFDIFCVETNGSAITSYLVARHVAAGATVLDQSEFRSYEYKLPAHTQAGVDTSGPTPIFIPGPRTFRP